ncbi:PHD finger protein 14-like isoform X2 [Acyrthosiphon pisum]|uniref:Uncharacterized protein n=1 Tax=Acyrthosiphon pisum TaxID=7029 RepID=A0A8R2H6R4_ACYPI|nr:PHD finger protein 14-like isoform X2 [Acyrthosiphon pisum]|eukprot:XP_016658232.1 PREDICTED: PHD finger protein 14-like isoform X2 [Acyrthosiphon pisum]
MQSDCCLVYKRSSERDHYINSSINSESDSGDSNFTIAAGFMTPTEDNSIKVNLRKKEDNIHVCSICLGDAGDDVNELIHFDECAISIHESCYGVCDSGSVNSSVSSCSTKSWFCEAIVKQALKILLVNYVLILFADQHTQKTM